MNPVNPSTMETYHGHVRTPGDAIILFEACRLGLLPRVQRRLSEKERQSIKSGSVFVWDEREAGMRRWTDGKSWSASRVSGSFLTYREMEGKRGGGNAFAPPVTSIGRKSPNGDSDSDHGLDLEGPDGYRYKPDGLMKQSFSITTATHQKLHLISYYARSHPSSSNLVQPSQDPSLKHIRPAKGMYPESTVHEQQNVPSISHRPMLTTSFNPHHASSPLSGGYRPTSATHPHNYSQQPTLVNSYNGWLPSPTSTPPGNPSAIPQSHYPQTQLPPPLSNGNGTQMQQYERASYCPQGSPMQVEVSSQQTPHIGSMPSPLLHLRPSQQSQQSSPRLNHEVPLKRQHSAPPPLDNSGSMRYGSPSASSHTSVRTPPRTAEGWDVNPIRGSPEASNGVSLMPGETSPGGTKLLDVQDIPNDKLRLQDDAKTLRILDKSFAM